MLGAFRLRYLQLDTEVDTSLLDLVKSCKVLGGGMLCGQSRQVHQVVSMNEARAKVLGDQHIPKSLWPVILESPLKAFLYDRWSKKVFTETEAIYILLRKRSAFDVFCKAD